MDRADQTSDDYDNWCKDIADLKNDIENQKKEVETCSQPTSDPEERAKYAITITVSCF